MKIYKYTILQYQGWGKHKNDGKAMSIKSKVGVGWRYNPPSECYQSPNIAQTVAWAAWVAPPALSIMAMVVYHDCEVWSLLLISHNSHGCLPIMGMNTCQLHMQYRLLTKATNSSHAVNG